jgi:hypothetical protein
MEQRTMIIYCCSNSVLQVHQYNTFLLGMLCDPQQYILLCFGRYPHRLMRSRYEGVWQIRSLSHMEDHEILHEICTTFKEKLLERGNSRRVGWYRITIDEMRAFITNRDYFIHEYTADELKKLTVEFDIAKSTYNMHEESDFALQNDFRIRVILFL